MPTAELDEAEHDLCFSILFAARQTSRQSVYHARLLFGLEGADIERFRASPFAELQQLACVPGVVQCAFRERRWFWQRLFTATRPELRRQLTLMALQPLRRHRLAAAPPAAADGLTHVLCRAPRRGPYNSRPRKRGAPHGHSWTR